MQISKKPKFQKIRNLSNSLTIVRSEQAIKNFFLRTFTPRMNHQKSNIFLNARSFRTSS